MNFAGCANTLDIFRQSLEFAGCNLFFEETPGRMSKGFFTMFDHSEPHHYTCNSSCPYKMGITWNRAGHGRSGQDSAEMRGVVKSLHHFLQVYVLVLKPDAQDVPTKVNLDKFGKSLRHQVLISGKAHLKEQLAEAKSAEAQLKFLVPQSNADAIPATYV